MPFMSKMSGYILGAIGFGGFIFFISYNGTAIPVKELWLVLSIFLLMIGSYFVAKHKFGTQGQQQFDNSRLQQINNLKQTGERIRITLDNCEIKSRSFVQENINDSLPTRTEMIDSLYDDNRNYKTREITQTYIVFYKKYDDQFFKFISQATTQSTDVLRSYLDNQNGIDLYIDKQNRNNYFFDLPFI